tara:strand:+ start:396 stop:641 length:246 start_codon:yes stop_codon:yes gene_type:complete
MLQNTRHNTTDNGGYKMRGEKTIRKDLNFVKNTFIDSKNKDAVFLARIDAVVITLEYVLKMRDNFNGDLSSWRNEYKLKGE